MTTQADFNKLKQLDLAVDCDDFVSILGFEFPMYPEGLELNKFMEFDLNKYKSYGFTNEQAKTLFYFARLLTIWRKSSLYAKLLAPETPTVQKCKVESMLENTKTHKEFENLVRTMKPPSASSMSQANRTDIGIFNTVYLGKDAEVQSLVGKDPACVNKKNRYGWTPLHYVMCIGCSDTATILIEAGANPTLLNNDQVSSMVLGAKWGHRSTVNNVCIALTSRKSAAYVKKLLRTVDSKNRHPLHYAAENKQHVVCDVLLGFGADPNHPDDLGRTPTFLACQTGNLDTVKILHTKWGGDIQMMDKQKMTPFSAFPKDKKLLDSLLMSEAEMDQE